MNSYAWDGSQEFVYTNFGFNIFCNVYDLWARSNN